MERRGILIIALLFFLFLIAVVVGFYNLGRVVFFDCEEDWACTSWSDCINETEVRRCVDLNACGTSLAKPLMIKSCSANECSGEECESAEYIEECVDDSECSEEEICEDGFCVYSDFSGEGEETFEEDTEISEEECAGCFYDSQCFIYGKRVLEDGAPKYCDSTGSFKDQKNISSKCDKDYECGSNSCYRKICAKTKFSLFRRLICSFLHPISNEERERCLEE